MSKHNLPTMSYRGGEFAMWITGRLVVVTSGIAILYSRIEIGIEQALTKHGDVGKWMPRVRTCVKLVTHQSEQKFPHSWLFHQTY